MNLLQHEAWEHAENLQLDIVAKFITNLQQTRIGEAEIFLVGPQARIAIRRVGPLRRRQRGGDVVRAALADQDAAARLSRVMRNVVKNK